ncbi:MAG: hypothetical protein GY834_11245 [Bacteroidetes bacterium]|nr:hypothetical protein [Bacteroidota bacterium]
MLNNKELYDKRWVAEEEVKKFMQRLIIEFFSSIINQDGREIILEISLADSLLKNRLNRIVMQNINEVKSG